MNLSAFFDTHLLGFLSPSPIEMMVIAVVALLLFGGNLPEVARSWGKTFAEFRRGLTGIQDELNEVIYSAPDQLAYYDEENRDEEYRDESNLITDGYNDQGYDESEYARPAEEDDGDEESMGDDIDAATSEADEDTIVEDKPTA